MTDDRPKLTDDQLKVHYLALRHKDSPTFAADLAALEAGLVRSLTINVHRYNKPYLDIADGLQVARTSIIEALPFYDPQRPVAPFLATVVRHRLWTLVKHNKRKRPFDVLSLEESRTKNRKSLRDILVDYRTSTSPTHDLETRELAQLVWRGICELLTPLELAVYRGLVLDGRTYDELAKEHGVSKKAVDNARCRGVNKLGSLVSKAVTPENLVELFASRRLGRASDIARTRLRKIPRRSDRGRTAVSVPSLQR